MVRAIDQNPYEGFQLILDDLKNVKREILDTPQQIFHIDATNGDDDDDGLTWENALQSIPAGRNKISSAVGNYGMLLLSSEDHDIDQSGDWDLNNGRHVGLMSEGRNLATIKNSNAGATSIMEITSPSKIKNINFELGSNQNGIEVTSDQVDIDECRLDYGNVTNAITGLHFENVNRGLVKDLICSGSSAAKAAGADGILIDGASQGIRITDSIVSVLDTGIEIGGTSLLNLIDKCKLYVNTLALKTGSSTQLNGFEVEFLRNTNRCDLQGTNNVLFPGLITIDSKIQKYYPSGPSAGVTLTSAADETHGTITTIIPSSTITKPFVVNEIYIWGQDAVNKNYDVNLYHTEGVDTQFETKTSFSAVTAGIPLPIDNIIFDQNTEISASIAVQDGASKIAKIKLGYYEI